ncbi:MAG: peptide deformylase [Candidatus Omnitrophota bacterium]
MRYLELKKYPDPCLRIKTKSVENFDQELKSILKKMADIMYVSQGIGLASTQVGLGSSIFVVDEGKGLINFINPEIIESSEEKSGMEEGCLSLPGVQVCVYRPVAVKIRAQDENGKFFVKRYDGLMAKAVQHENDHLNGKLIIDYLNPIRRFISKLHLHREGKKTCEVICDARKNDI